MLTINNSLLESMRGLARAFSSIVSHPLEAGSCCWTLLLCCQHIAQVDGIVRAAPCTNQVAFTRRSRGAKSDLPCTVSNRLSVTAWMTV